MLVPTKTVAPLLACVALWLTDDPPSRPPARGVLVNDVHSQLNQTRVDRVVSPDSIAAIQAVVREARAKARSWGIRQKQAGADRLSLGGALSANAHGRGLRFKPTSWPTSAGTCANGGRT